MGELYLPLFLLSASMIYPWYACMAALAGYWDEEIAEIDIGN